MTSVGKWRRGAGFAAAALAATIGSALPGAAQAQETIKIGILHSLSGTKLLVLDEPTEGIQPSIIKDIGGVIALLRDRGDIVLAGRQAS